MEQVRPDELHSDREVVLAPQRGYEGGGTCLCLPIAIGTGTNSIDYLGNCGTGLIDDRETIQVEEVGKGTGAVLGNKLSRSQEFIQVQDFCCGQLR